MSKKYQFVDQLPDDVFCPICLDLLEEPHQITCCGQHLCKSCGKRSPGPCPLCRSKQYHFVPDKYFERNTLNCLTVRCSEKECSWKGELSSFNDHVLRKCEYVIQSCPNECGYSFQRYRLKEHATQLCPNRAHTCKYCGLVSTFSQIQTSHISACPKEPIPCPNNCQDDAVQYLILRERMPDHLENECPLKVIECTICQLPVPRKDLQQHMVDYSLQHAMSKMCESFQIMSDNTNSKLKEMNEQMKKMNYQLKEKDQQLALKNYELTEKGRQLNEKDQQLAKKDILLDEKDKEIAKQVVRMKLLEDKVDQLLNMSLEEQRYYEVKGFSSLCANQTRWFSRPFFTHAGGYKMCFELDLCSTQGKNLRIDSYLMQGPFDDYLTWPFTGRIAVRVLSHVSDSNYFDYIFDYDSIGAIGARERVEGAGRSEYLQSTSTKMKIKTMQEKHMLDHDTLKLRVNVIRS